MAKNKPSPASSKAAARSSETQEMVELQTINKQLTKEIAQSRRHIGRLRLQLASLAPGQDDQDILAANTVSNAVQNLKSLNIRLVKQVEESRKEINGLLSELALSVADQDILTGVEHDVFNLVFYSSLSKAVTSRIAHMVATRKKTKSNAVELEALEIQKHVLHGEKDNLQRDIECITKERDSSLLSLKQMKKNVRDLKHKRSGKIWRWICCVTVTSICAYIY